MKVSILDYAPKDEGMTAHEAFLATTELAQLADELGYHRFWVAEHHNVPVLTGSSPEILMAHLASKTKKIRIGSGGVMLPNYSAYKVAENFKVLEALYPNRIDAGIGNSPGGDKLVSEALNEGKINKPDYTEQVRDLKGFLTDSLPKGHKYKSKRAAPIIETKPEMHLLAASSRNATVAAETGAGFTFAHFINPLGKGQQAIEEYRAAFQPTELANKPHVMAAVFVVVGKTIAEAEELAAAFDLWHLSSQSTKRASYYLPTPGKARQTVYSKEEEAVIKKNRRKVIIGDPEMVKRELIQLKEMYQADELLIVPNVYSIEKRMQSIRLLAEVMDLSED